MSGPTLTRRGLVGGAAAIPLLGALGRPARAAGELTIAYNVNLPSMDPTAGPSAVNPTIQSLYQSIFDPYIGQNPDLSFRPALLTEWGWNEDRTKIRAKVRADAVWHDGAPVTAGDVAWSLTRAGAKDSANPVSFIWSKIGNVTAEGDTVTADVLQFEPTLFKWMAFLTGYVLPRAYYEKVGPAGFEAAPIGSGPYMVDHFERNAFLRLRANARYWGGKPAYDTVTFKFVTDQTSRVAEIESGSADVTLEVPFEEFDRLRGKAGLVGVAQPISDIAMIFISDVPPMLDQNVRLAAHAAIDKQAIVAKLLHGYAVPLNTLEAPDYAAFDPATIVAHDPEAAKALLAKSGFSPSNPVKFTIQTTRGFKPKDFEAIQAIVGMWRKVGIEATVEVYEIAKHYELRAAHKLAPAAFYNWGNAIGDPTTSTGFAMYRLSPHSGWHGQALSDKIDPLWGEKDEATRIAGWKAVDRVIAEQGLVIPLWQYEQPILHKASVKVTPSGNGMLLPFLMSPA